MNVLLLSNGKLITVFVVVFIILIGLITFLFSIDRKLTKIEKEIK
jgi:preprotein translocase subunit SecE